MIVSFRKSSSKQPKNPLRAAKGATGYLLGNKDHKGRDRAIKPVLLSGSPEEFEQIVGFGNKPGKYTSGGLYFEESREDLIKKFGSEKAVHTKLQEIMDAFESTLFFGLEKDQYCGVWVLHEDKGNIELNFLFAKEELRSGKGLTPYYHKNDLKRVNAFKDIVNNEYDLSDPNSPNKKRIIKPEFFNEYKTIDFNSKESKRRNFKQLLTEEIEIMTAGGQFSDRNDLIEYLEKQKKLKISRTTPNAISVINPNTNKPTRLKGAIFEEKTDYKIFSDENYRKELIDRYEEERYRRIKEQKEEYKSLMLAKKKELMKKINNKNKENEDGETYQGNDFKLFNESRSENDEARTREQASERRDIEREKAFTTTHNALREQAEQFQNSSFKRFERNVEQLRSTSNPFKRIIERIREINDSIKIKTKKKSLKNDERFSM